MSSNRLDMDVNQTHTHVKTLHSTWMSVILTSMSQAVIDTDVRQADMDVQCDMGVNTVDTHVKTQNRLTHTHDMDVKCFDTHVHQRHSCSTRGTQGRLAPPSEHKIRAATTTKTTFHQQGQGDKHGGQFEQTAL